VLPLLLVTTVVVVAGCLRQAAPVATSTPRQSDVVPPSVPIVAASRPLGLGQDDPRLEMRAVAGRNHVDRLALWVQVLPAGNVTTAPPALDIVPTTVTRWVMNGAATTLWSGPTAVAAAFTDVPSDSFFRVTGPEQGQRLPVYYVGDGLLRERGSGWVDVGAVKTVDAPAPGQVPAVDAEARQPLPVWVQAHRATTLWSGPDKRAVILTDLPQWTFLKTSGIERDGRLLANYAGDYASRQPGIGWVDQSSIGPSGNPGVWVTNHRATALWSGVDEKALKFTELPQWTKLRIVPGAPDDPDRLQVEFFGDGFTRQPGMAWILLADIGPITPPVPLPSTPVAAKAQPLVERHTFASTTEFLDLVGAAAQNSMKSTGVPASVTVAQAILESDWGRSRLTRQGNNLFGIKALGTASGPAGVVSLTTWEHTDSGGDVIVQAPFRAYYTLEQSIDDHGRFFIRNHRYAAAMAVASDPGAFARAIQDAGYATDPGYASKLIGLMDRYDLYRFDS
jgi:hypothetical protein